MDPPLIPELQMLEIVFLAEKRISSIPDSDLDHRLSQSRLLDHLVHPAVHAAVVVKARYG